MNSKDSGQKTIQNGILKKLTGNTVAIIFLISVGMMILTSLVNPAVFSAYNISTMLRTMSFVTIVSFGQTLCMINGDIDLSIGAIACLTGIMTGYCMQNIPSINPFVWLVIGVIFGGMLGLVNGLLITYCRLTPFIVTLATSMVYEGFVYVITGGKAIINLPKEIAVLGSGMIANFFAVPFIIMIVIAVILSIVLKRSVFGRQLFAVGGNPKASKMVGIQVDSKRRIVYVLAGMLAATAGLLMMCRFKAAQASVGLNWTMPSITAAVLGGTSMNGGRGSVAGTIVGALLTTVLSNVIVILGVSSYYENVVIGCVVVIAVLIDTVRNSLAKK